MEDGSVGQNDWKFVQEKYVYIINETNRSKNQNEYK